MHHNVASSKRRLRIFDRVGHVFGNMGLLDLPAKAWGHDYWYELNLNEKIFTIFIIFDLIFFSPFLILDLLDIMGLI
mgnify:CR=1 FL=1|jgi:hypothetical protein